MTTTSAAPTPRSPGVTAGLLGPPRAWCHPTAAGLLAAACLALTPPASAQRPVGRSSAASHAGLAPAPAAAPARVAACRARVDQMRRALRDVHARQRNVGLGAAVLLGDELVLSEGLGYADLEHRVPVTRDTRFGVASVTKAFTGVALLALRESGRVDLDAPIQRYVPDFPVKPGRAITPRLLAAHLAGLRHWKEGERTPVLYATHFADVAGLLPLFKDDTLVVAPGTQYSYSSHGYNLLAAAVQAAAGERFQNYVTRTVIAPLGLRSTGFDDVRLPNPHRARRYAFYDPFTLAADTTRVYRIPDWDYSHNTGGGNMYATADDLARFGRALMRPGLLSPASLALLYAKPRVDTVESPMSFGWFVREAGAGGPATRGRRLHITGANPGLQAGLQVYPDDDLVTVVLSNTHGVGARSGEMVSELPERVAAICLGRPVPPVPGAPRP